MRLQDQYLIWISAGILTLVVPKIFQQYSLNIIYVSYFLLMAIIFFILVIILTIICLNISSKHLCMLILYSDYLRKNRVEEEETKKLLDKSSKLGGVIDILSLLCIIFFILGFIFLFLFIYINFFFY